MQLHLANIYLRILDYFSLQPQSKQCSIRIQVKIKILKERMSECSFYFLGFSAVERTCLGRHSDSGTKNSVYCFLVKSLEEGTLLVFKMEIMVISIPELLENDMELDNLMTCYHNRLRETWF